jgi:hypothetical protein
MLQRVTVYLKDPGFWISVVVVSVVVSTALVMVKAPGHRS